MTTIDIKKTTLQACVGKAQSDRVVVTKNGSPVALVVGVKGLDGEQLTLGASKSFWSLIRARRKEKAITRAALERKLKRSRVKRRRA